jgi:hypothetical protein
MAYYLIRPAVGADREWVRTRMIEYCGDEIVLELSIGETTG